MSVSESKIDDNLPWKSRKTLETRDVNDLNLGYGVLRNTRIEIVAPLHVCGFVMLRRIISAKCLRLEI